jgi:endonuclease YncB( thermonuclease family)
VTTVASFLRNALIQFLQFQFNNAADIPAIMFHNDKSIYGRVVRVADGDTFRVRHYPLYPIQKESQYEGKLADNTIQVRLYGIDAPEIERDGKSYPSMPYAEEAKAWTAAKVNGQIVEVKLFQKDQYNRVLGKVTTTTTLTLIDISVGLLHNGYATLYEGKGAEYDGNKDKMTKEIEYAQKNRLGIWTNGIENVQSPAEYKRIMRSKQSEANLERKE